MDATLRLVFEFCQSTPVKYAAINAGTSERTARQTYLELRERLLRPAFNRWHRNNAYRPAAGAAKSHGARVALLTAKGECLANATCVRNHRAGNRKSRECLSCPISTLVSSKKLRSRHLAHIDLIHSFYEALGIRGERHLSAFDRFHLRETHFIVFLVAHANTRRVPSGYMDTNQETFLSAGTLLKTMLSELLERPLGSEPKKRAVPASRRPQPE